MSNDAQRTPKHVPINLARLYRDGVSAFDRGDFDAAVAALTVVHAQPGVPGTLARYYLGEARRQQGYALLRQTRFAEAAESLREAARLNPGSAELADQLARCYCAAGRHDLAGPEFEKAASLKPGRSTLAIRQAHNHWRAGERERALSILHATARAHPRDGEPLFQLGLMQAAGSDESAAITLLRECVRIAPRHAEAHRYLGLLYATSGRIDESVSALTQAQNLRPRDPSLAMELALALQAAGKSAAPVIASSGPFVSGDAIERLGKVLLLEPELTDTFLVLPSTPRDGEIFDILARAIDAALKTRPDYADLHHYAARVRARLGQLNEAIASEDRAIAINPMYVQAWIHAAQLLVQMRRYDDAVDRFEHAIERGGDYADVHFAVGELHRRAGKLEQARASYRRALQLNEHYAAARQALKLIAA